jgi:PleD family two-component response regulator
MQNHPVLIVDDMKLARLKLSQICKNLGFTQILEAANGEEAMTILGKIKPVLILSDYNMPVMNGLELLQRVRETPAMVKIPVIFITSESERTLILSAVTLGVAEYVVKPFTDEILQQKIKEVLSKAAA